LKNYEKILDDKDKLIKDLEKQVRNKEFIIIRKRKSNKNI